MKNKNVDTKIQIQTVSNLDCLQECLYLVFEKNLMFTNMPLLACWSFEYTRSSNVIGEGLGRPTEIFINDVLRNVLNIPVEFYENSGIGDLKVIGEAIEKREKVIVGIDAFYCPWNISYQKAHILHFFIIESIDTKSKNILVNDPFVSKELQKSDVKSFEKMYKNARVIKSNAFISQHAISQKILVEILCSNYSNLPPNRSIKGEYIKFANAIESVNDIFQLVEQEDVRLCVINRELKIIAGIRSSIAYVLGEYEKSIQKTVFSSLYKNFYDMANRLQRINMLLLRVQIKRKVDKASLATIACEIRELGELEENTYDTLRTSLNSKEGLENVLEKSGKYYLQGQII